MKIIAEFNSTSEVIDFINAFGAKSVENKESIDSTEQIKIFSKSIIENIKEDKKDDVSDIDVKVEEKEKSQKVEQSKDTEDKKCKEVTKEQVREVFSKLIKAGKSKEAKELTSKYGANKLGEVKREDYEAILKEAEELL